MSRPRTVSDEQILVATMKMMAKLGPVKLTLADVAEEAGLSPAALIKRFGSKRELLLAVSNSASGGMDEAYDALRRAHDSPIDALLAAATFLAKHTRSAEELANHLAFLQIDVTDPDFRKPMLEMSRSTLKGYQALLDDAVAAGELRRCDTAALAHAVNAIVGGSLISWAVFRKGSADKWVRRDIETLLAPYRK
jgi:AcrR family transcriptional regulator